MSVQSSGPAEGLVACSTSSVLLRRVRAAAGEDGVLEVLRRAGVDQPPSYFDDIGNWMPYADSLALFDAAVDFTGDDRLAQRVGEDTVRQHAGTPVAALFRSLGSPEAVYEQLAIGVGKFTTVTAIEPEEVTAGRATVRAWARPGYVRGHNMCLLMLGMLSQPTVLFGLPPAAVEHSECELRGAPHCRYVITWDAGQAAESADPEKLVTALEARLAAMSDRLDSMYATARDLIAVDDLDEVLERITRRAATAVRAPSYVLAVRTTDDDEPRVHHRGLAGSEVAEAARALLDGAADDGTRLVADIASATRHYGQIMASSPAGSFFPHERDLLAVYGSYAAAVLDTHTAIRAAQDSAKQSRALLQLATALAAAPTGAEVAHRLIDAIPAVVDCDRVAVFLWEEETGTLRFEATTNLPDDLHEHVVGLQIRPSDTPVFARLVESPSAEPLFFGPDTDDPFVLGLMAQTSVVRIAVAPIVTGDRFHGVLSVSVTDRPGRLQERPALRDGLAGIVALAATALENARLIETMSHQARHDNLTGLPGHRSFHEALGEYGAGADDHVLTLAAIDIDDFKAINDQHGHPVGDEALRHVSRALRDAVREHDTVFRVGGEEFAVLLPGLTAAEAAPVVDRLRLAVGASSFHLPLRISVGVASCESARGVRDLVDRADAALYAAKRAGKDRVVAV